MGQGSSRSQFLVEPFISLNDVNSKFNLWQTQASILPFQHPHRAVIAHNIAAFRFERYKATRQKEDLDQAIVGFAEALLRGMYNPTMIISTFEHLTRALSTRFKDFGAREDLDHIILYFRHLSNFPPDVAGITRVYVLGSLAGALLSRFEVGGQQEDIEDSISLLRYVITIVPPGTDDYRLITSKLANAWKRKYEQTNESEDLTEAMNHYRAVLASCPLDHPSRHSYLGNLMDLLTSRFERSGDLNDVQDAATLCQESLDLLEKEDPERMWVLMNLANTYHSRFSQTDDSEDLEKAISLYREALPLCPPGNESEDILLTNFGLSLISRFQKFGRMGCLEEAISLNRTALRLCPRGHPRRQLSLCGLAAAIRLRCLRTHRIEDLEESIAMTGDMGCLEEGIEHLYEASKLLKSGQAKSRYILQLLAANLLDRLKHCGADKDIVDAIKHHRTSISLIPERHRDVTGMRSHFASDLRLIFFLTGDAKHLEESITLHQSAVEYPFSGVRDRLNAAYKWIVTVRSTRHSSALTAYCKALSLLQRAIDLGPTVQTQHEYISGKCYQSLPMDAASCVIKSCGYECYAQVLSVVEVGSLLAQDIV